MISVFVESTSICAPGLNNWSQSIAILSGVETYVENEIPKYIPTFLPANERRRTNAVIKLALQAAHECLQQTKLDAQQIASVFATSEGDTLIVDSICRTLTQPEPMLSPTQFHNSVHNAPAGYWAMGTQSRQASTSLSGREFTYSDGLLEAISMVCAENATVLLVAYDFPSPPPLLASVPMTAPYATAHLLSPQQGPDSMGRLDISLVKEHNVTTMHNADLNTLRLGNPAARSLPLLSAIAINEPKQVVLAYLDDRQIAIQYSPC